MALLLQHILLVILDPSLRFELSLLLILHFHFAKTGKTNIRRRARLASHDQHWHMPVPMGAGRETKTTGW